MAKTTINLKKPAAATTMVATPAATATIERPEVARDVVHENKVCPCGSGEREFTRQASVADYDGDHIVWNSVKCAACQRIRIEKIITPIG